EVPSVSVSISWVSPSGGARTKGARARSYVCVRMGPDGGADGRGRRLPGTGRVARLARPARTLMPAARSEATAERGRPGRAGRGGRGAPAAGGSAHRVRRALPRLARAPE